MGKGRHYFILGIIAALIATGAALAQSSSTNYSVREYYFGNGGQLDSGSTNFQARVSIGDTGVGYGESANFGAWAGYTTTNDPFIELVVTASSTDLGVLSPSSAATATGAFYVRTYLASGYAITTGSAPPTNESGDTLAPMTAGGTSSPGTEQFGINLVANTSPATFGANPVQVPDASFSFGYAATGYDTANNFRYNKGDVIAKSNSSTGRTDYTVSYLFNISNVTPAGNYIFNHYIVATSTF